MWMRGAIAGFLFIPALFLVSVFLMTIAAALRLETAAGIIDAIFMLLSAPTVFIQQKLGINVAPPLLSIPFWAILGALIGYLVDYRNRSR